MATGGDVYEKNYVTLLWKIENIRSFDKELHDGVIVSPELHIGAFGDGSFGKLAVYPNCETQTIESFRIMFFLFSGIQVSIDIEFSLLCWDGSTLSSGTLSNLSIWQSGTEILMPATLSLRDLLNREKKNPLNQETVTVLCRIWRSFGSFVATESITAGSQIDVSEDYCMWPIVNYTPRGAFYSFRLFEDRCCAEFQLNVSLTGNAMDDFVFNVEPLKEVGAGFLLKVKLIALGNDGKRSVKIWEEQRSFMETAVPESKQIWHVTAKLLIQDVVKKMGSVRLGYLTLYFHFTYVKSQIPGFVKRNYNFPRDSLVSQLINGSGRNVF